MTDKPETGSQGGELNADELDGVSGGWNPFKRESWQEVGKAVTDTANKAADAAREAAEKAATAAKEAADKAAVAARESTAKAAETAKHTNNATQVADKQIDEHMVRLTQAGDRFNVMLDGITKSVNDRASQLGKANFRG